MHFQRSITVCVLLKYTLACIPTQQVDSNSPGGTGGTGGTGGNGVTTTSALSTTTASTTTTTTTIATTTTTVTEEPFPCTVCQKAYDTSCKGFGIPNLLQWCPTAAELGIKYIVGLLPLFPFLPSDTCSTVVICPLGTTVFYSFLGLETPGVSPIIAWCKQSGPDAGNWFTGTEFLKFQLVSLVCRPIISG
ncbi:DUF282 domain-containing protein [Caenorhabditis elegans]|uniref:Secreted protein n=1 Tax=Caenorhabditis elegans TaxID=6239 RepID=E5QCE5_CAEEL|nr:Secreted protein [Caenorhabditis elegans]CCD64560.1 Secreted protein [Caenorhabditis elegans]|eukprot:NP_001257039.1 Uncharacterized protein CELE_T13C5.9 [Caenorhabditis elegans]